MLSQFTTEGGHKTLADIGRFPGNVYAVGRLDADSEGLLFLTDDKRLNEYLLNPLNSHPRTYLVQVEGEITMEAVKQLEKGVKITVSGREYITLPAKASILDSEPLLPERDPPVRFRKSIPTSWLELTLVEGKNRQVRKMTAAAGFPTLRLVRTAIGELVLGNMQPGQVIRLPGKVVYEKLGIRASPADSSSSTPGRYRKAPR
jgi:23S rRNA pseudouridine2457 synthase